jgi:hypothetical protein
MISPDSQVIELLVDASSIVIAKTLLINKTIRKQDMMF